MNYRVSYSNPHNHFIDIECEVKNVDQDILNFQLPAWRPGRYELGNFAKNVQKWIALDEVGNVLPFKKISKDRWQVTTKSAKKIIVKYNYFSNELNAGSTFLDESQLYINPVNCMLFIPERLDEECILELDIPGDYKVATSLKKSGNLLIASDFHELADSPLIASNSLKHFQFVIDGVEFNLWFQGECKPLPAKLVNDFFIFINEQFVMMKEFVTDEYHFLFQIAPYRLYHGVEHLKSTVIALGPSYNLMQGDLYENLLGISSHELFHAWNVKAVRSAEMTPYDYTKENYSRLGYVCEGLTTYYGDLLLFRSGVFSEVEFFKTINENLQKHFDNFGRFNLSVADSSYDTWLDGYVPGIPNRKTSIYTEGALCAFMADVLIRKHSNNVNCLDDVMRELYYNFGKKNKGYTEEDYKKALERYAGISFDDFFSKYLWGVTPYDDLLNECFSYVGLSIHSKLSKKISEAYLGFKTIEDQGNTKVSAIYPSSIADKAGIGIQDKIIAVNNIEISHNLNEWLNYFMKDELELTVSTGSLIRNIRMKATAKNFYKTYTIAKAENPFEQQQVNFEKWSKRKL